MSNVINLENNDGDLRNIKETLEKAVIDCSNPDKLIAHSNKMLIITLDDTQGLYEFGFINCHLSMSESLALLECAKILVLDEMGIVNI